MPMQQTVLLVGGTGRTGRRALQQLLDRGVRVRAIVRSGAKLSRDVAGSSNLTVTEASLLSLRDEELQQHLRGCDMQLRHPVGVRFQVGVPSRLGALSGIGGLQPAGFSRDGVCGAPYGSLLGAGLENLEGPRHPEPSRLC